MIDLFVWLGIWIEASERAYNDLILEPMVDAYWDWERKRAEREAGIG